MKLNPLFTVKNNQLIKIEDNSLTDTAALTRIELSWAKIELEEETYNEEFLADLRNQLKEYDKKKQFVILVPVTDKKLETPDDFELFTKTFNHTARRIKDCISVLGYELPELLLLKGLGDGTFAKDFMDTLAIKHAQYVYFVKEDVSKKFLHTSDPAFAKLVIY